MYGVVQSINTDASALATLPPASLKSIFQAWIGDIMGDEKLVGQLAVDGKALRATAKGKEPTLFIWSMSGQLSWECVLASKKSLTNLTRSRQYLSYSNFLN